LISPTFTTIRQWLLKLAFFKLTRPKDRSGTWVHIVDATIQMGAQKAVLVLGLRLDNAENSFSPTLEQVEPLVLKTVTSCPGEVIMEALKEASDKTGSPVSVISDEGSEMNRGARLLSSETELVHLHDCTHKVNNVLKSTLRKDDLWHTFKKDSSSMIQSVKLSHVAHLAPPKQREKARMLASDSLVTWGIKLLNYLDSQPDLPEESLAKIRWIRKYRKKLGEWSMMLQLTKSAIAAVTESGYHLNTPAEWELRVAEKPLKTASLKLLHDNIKEVLVAECAKVPEGERHLGNSVVIESAFGKYKSIQKQFSCFGLTSLVLALPALVSPTTLSDIEEAMKMVTNNDVKAWLEKNLGETYLSKRRADLAYNTSCMFT
jgi:hypothetical protein